MSSITFADLPLAGPIQRALRDQNYTQPTPIQEQAIPPQLEGKDIIGCAQTGTGKTAAFALPILHHLATKNRRSKRGQVRVLVLTPTRELAIQVGKSFTQYGSHLKLRHALVYGGVSQHPQTRALSRGVEVLVATPGRLLDLLEQGYLTLGYVECLILDEVDRMLDMGFVHDVRRIAKALPEERQTALFTATLDKRVESIAAEFVKQPVRISITPEAPVVDKIDQKVCFVQPENKAALLQVFLREQAEREGKHATIVFCRTKFGTQKLSKLLNRHGFQSDAIHGDKSQGARQRALNDFRTGKLPILVATDVAARGIDVRSISLVVNFDLPEGADNYVHRIGRTARAEATGTAISFCTSRDINLLRQIESYIGQPVPVENNQPFHDKVAADKAENHGRHRSHSFRKSGHPHKRRQPNKGGKGAGKGRPFRGNAQKRRPQKQKTRR